MQLPNETITFGANVFGLYETTELKNSFLWWNIAAVNGFKDDALDDGEAQKLLPSL